MLRGRYRIRDANGNTTGYIEKVKQPVPSWLRQKLDVLIVGLGLLGVGIGIAAGSQAHASWPVVVILVSAGLGGFVGMVVGFGVEEIIMWVGKLWWDVS